MYPYISCLRYGRCAAIPNPLATMRMTSSSPAGTLIPCGSLNSAGQGSLRTLLRSRRCCVSPLRGSMNKSSVVCGPSGQDVTTKGWHCAKDQGLADGAQSQRLIYCPALIFRGKGSAMLISTISLVRVIVARGKSRLQSPLRYSVRLQSRKVVRLQTPIET